MKAKLFLAAIFCLFTQGYGQTDWASNIALTDSSVTGLASGQNIYVRRLATKVTKPFSVLPYMTFHVFAQDTSSGTDSVSIRIELWQTSDLANDTSWVRTVTLDDSLTTGDVNSNFWGVVPNGSFSTAAVMPFGKLKLVGQATNSKATPVLVKIRRAGWIKL